MFCGYYLYDRLFINLFKQPVNVSISKKIYLLLLEIINLKSETEILKIQLLQTFQQAAFFKEVWFHKIQEVYFLF